MRRGNDHRIFVRLRRVGGADSDEHREREKSGLHGLLPSQMLFAESTRHHGGSKSRKIFSPRSPGSPRSEGIYESLNSSLATLAREFPFRTPALQTTPAADSAAADEFPRGRRRSAAALRRRSRRDWE